MKADLIERLQAAATGSDDLSSNVSNALLREAAAALEAEASEGERRGLERAAQMAEVIASQMRAVQEEWRTPKNDLVAHLTHNAFKYKADLAQDIAAKVRALNPEATAREGWQPIETAPKDGTRFLALEGSRHFDCWWHWFGADQVYNWQDDADSEPNPTHWRPLPPPPSQDREPDSQRGAK